MPGYFQPVLIRCAESVRISVAAGGAFAAPEPTPVMVGLLVAPVYRFKLTDIPFREGEELFPTVEVIDRVYPPTNRTPRFAIPIDITQQDMELALDGHFVTRVVYVEDPENAVPNPEPTGHVAWHDVAPGDDPLVAADHLGRPAAIVRIGGRVPMVSGPDQRFLHGSPPMVRFPIPQPRPAGPLPFEPSTPHRQPLEPRH